MEEFFAPEEGLIVEARRQAASRNLPLVGQVYPLEGAIIRRAGNGAVVLTDWVGQDEETGLDLYGSVAFVTWESPR
jgi:hypothetical protein